MGEKIGMTDAVKSQFLTRLGHKKVQFKLEGKPHPKCRRGKKKLELHKHANKLLRIKDFVLRIDGGSS
ncbi:unknown protein [Simkania negevensis Z]|uniref:Uncharacterized protein n=1 Tax=Simkania negevensis (strain ATCC VR-1471 / DSM 27360 / Z) TaxID=331113 RepID=F8L4N9_SIMNZ|nr:unknown protein [Simkania negevensis Z]